MCRNYFPNIVVYLGIKAPPWVILAKLPWHLPEAKCTCLQMECFFCFLSHYVYTIKRFSRCSAILWVILITQMWCGTTKNFFAIWLFFMPRLKSKYTYRYYSTYMISTYQKLTFFKLLRIDFSQILKIGSFSTSDTWMVL